VLIGSAIGVGRFSCVNVTSEVESFKEVTNTRIPAARINQILEELAERVSIAATAHKTGIGE